MAAAAELRAYYDAVDVDGAGIGPAELQQALGKSGYVFSLQACAQIIRVHDHSADGRIDFQEFAGLHAFLADAHAAFARAAGGAPGARLDAEALRAVVGERFAWLERPALDAAARAFDPAGGGSWGVAELVALLVFLKSAVATFRGFDAAGGGTVSMGLSQFVYAASNTR
jgi:hypothetical protein